VYCDGSVHGLPTSTREVTLGLLAQRDDHQVIPNE
jgi:hypothetical protein